MLTQMVLRCSQGEFLSPVRDRTLCCRVSTAYLMSTVE